MNNEVMFSKKSDEWSTPQSVFDELNAEFDFNLDPCSTDENHKTPFYFTKESDGLSQNWGGGACSVIRLIQISAVGLKRLSVKDTRTGQSLFCLFQHEPTRSISTITF